MDTPDESLLRSDMPNCAIVPPLQVSAPLDHTIRSHRARFNAAPTTDNISTKYNLRRRCASAQRVPSAKRQRTGPSHDVGDGHAADVADVATATSDPAAPVLEVMGMEITPLGIRDVPAVFHLGEGLFSAKTLPNIFRMWDEYVVTEAFSASPDTCFVAKMPSSVPGGRPEVIGFLLGYVINKEAHHIAYVEYLGVAVPYQRRGVATAMYNRFKTAAIEEYDATAVVADTQRNNFPSLCFMAKMGLDIPVDHVYLSLNLEKAGASASGYDSSNDKKAREGKGERGKGTKQLNVVAGSVNVRFTAEIVPRDARNGTGKGALATDRRKKISVNIRQMVLDDLHSVYELGNQLFTDMNPNLYRFWDETGVVELYQTDAEMCLVAATDAGEIVAFCLGTTIEKRQSAWKYGYLTWLGVSRELQGCGLAVRMFECFRSICVNAKARMMIIDTEAKNAGAIRFFNKLGFGHPEPHVYISGNICQPAAQNRPQSDTVMRESQ